MRTDRKVLLHTTAAVAIALLMTASLCIAQVEILRPDEGTTLSGRVTVVVQTGSEDVLGIHTRIGDRPWVAMRLTEDGTWRATMDTALAPNGPTAIRVQQWPVGDDCAAEIDVALDNPLRHYWGNMHSHTSVSDGRMRPDEAYAYARDIAGLDFFSLADHLEQVEPAEWRETLRAARLATQDGVFVGFNGLEWTKRVGHMCVFEPAGHIWPLTLDEFYQFAPENCAVATFNHPGWRDTTFEDFRYCPVGYSVVQLIEVRNDAEMAWYIEALNKGWHLSPDGSDDTHRERWGTSGRWTVVLAPGLSYHTVMDALQSRRTYSTRDRNCVLTFSINEAVMGEVIEPPVTTALVSVRVDDPDEDDLIAKIELFENGEVIRSDEPQRTSRHWSLILTPEPGSHYYFVKVTQADGDVLYSAPIWLTVADR